MLKVRNKTESIWPNTFHNTLKSTPLVCQIGSAIAKLNSLTHSLLMLHSCSPSLLSLVQIMSRCQIGTKTFLYRILISNINKIKKHFSNISYKIRIFSK